MNRFRQKIVELKTEDEKALLEGIEAYYKGQYGQAKDQLSKFANGEHSHRLLTLARFYSGAASASEYYLNGKAQPDKISDAKQQFKWVTEHDSQFQPPWDAISDMIKKIYQDKN
jgi:hypothetical protein